MTLFVYEHSDTTVRVVRQHMDAPSKLIVGFYPRRLQHGCTSACTVQAGSSRAGSMELPLPCLPPEVPDTLRRCDLQDVSQRNLHKCFYIDKDLASPSLSGNALKCKKPLSKHERLFVFSHVLVASSRAEAKEKIKANPDLLLAVEESLRASLRHPGVDEPWAEHEALMVDTLAGVCGLPHEVAAMALVQSDYDMVNALILTDDLREHGANSSAGWEGMGEIPSTFKSALAHANPSLQRLSPSSWRVLYDCHQRSESQDNAVDGSGSVLCGKYHWSENEEDEAVTVTVRAPAGVKKRDVVSVLSSTQWTLRVKGEDDPLISGLLWGVVMPDESFWTIDQDNIVMTLQKRECSGKWKKLIQDELHLTLDVMAKASALLAREEESRLEAVLAAMEECGSALRQLTSVSSRQQAPRWCCPSVMVSSLLCKAGGREGVNFHCVQWAGSEEGPCCCVGWPVDSLEEGQTVVAVL